MASTTRRSGLTLAILGLLGTAYFWVTDPHLGPTGRAVANFRGHADWRHWLYLLRGSPNNIIDASNQALTGTVVGIVGSVCVLLIGLWLLTRRSN